MDQRSSEGVERYLTRLPACIYLKFEDVSWIVDTRLGKGVYPLHPVQRTWILNESSGARIKRHGFTLLPDYAWTAFMSQGMNRKAGLADCGDVLDIPGLSEQMTTYVVLSRFTKACGLLVMRAFSHELFRSGAAPGPECLLKFLRHRFGAGASVDAYSASAARVEYAERLASYEALRTRIRDSGPRWMCHECSQEFLATGYGTTHTNTADVGRLCVAPG